jgi:hypothetical protein
MRKKWVLIAAACGIIAGLAVAAAGVLGPRTAGRSPASWADEAVYVFLTQDEMIDRADAIFAGTIVEISPTRWNQDSGEYYPPKQGIDYPMPLHEIEVQVTRPIIDTIGLGETVTVTVVSASPVDARSSDDVEHDLKVGDEVVMFVGQTELAWRGGGRKPVILFMSAPDISYLKLGSDGLYHGGGPEKRDYLLDDLIAEIESRRPVLP